MTLWAVGLALARLLFAAAGSLLLASPDYGAMVCEAALRTSWIRQDQVPPGIVVDQLHMILSASGDTLSITEVYLLGNQGDEVFRGEDGVTVVFPLPAGARQVSYEGAEDGTGPYLRVEGGIADTRPITPGVAMVEARFAYEVPFTPGAAMARALPLPVQSGVLLLTGASWKLAGRAMEAGAFVDLGVMDFSSELARVYMIEAMAAGEALDFEIVEEETPLSELLPPDQMVAAPEIAEPPVRVVDRTLELGIGVVAVAAALAASGMLWRDAEPVPPSAPPDEALADLRAIAELDAQFAAGQIDALSHRRLREGLKARVRTTLHDRSSRAD